MAHTYREHVLADERVQKVAERTLENAQKTKEKAKSWGFKGIGFLSSAVSTAKAAVAGVCVLILLYMCPHTAIYVSSYYYICFLIPALSLPQRRLWQVCVLILLYMCPQYYYICVLILLYMCPHTTIYVSSYYYICVLIRLYTCPRTKVLVAA